MVIIRRLTCKFGGALLAVLFVFMLIMPVMVNAAPSESPIHSHLSEVEVEDRNKTPQETTTDTAIPPPGMQLPGNEAGNGNQQGGNSDSSGSGNSGSNQEGNSQNSHSQDGNNSNMTPATPVPTDGVSVPGTGTIQTPGSNGTTTSTIDPNGVQTNPTDTSAVDTDNGDQQGNEQPDNRPWYEKLWDGTKDAFAHPVESLKNFGRGAVAGLVGAVAVVVVVAVVATLILSAPISTPILIAALVVGVVAGGIYGLVSGDNFNFWEGVQVGALGAAATIAIATSGVGAAFQGARQLLTKEGLRGATRILGGRGLTYLRGLGSSFIKGFRSPIKSLVTTLKSSSFKWTLGINTVVNFGNFALTNGRPPTLSESGLLLAQSVASSLLFSKVGDWLKTGVKNTLGKNAVAYTSGMFESIITTFTKHKIDPENNKNLSLGEQMRRTFVSTFMVAPAFSSILKNGRIKFNIGTSRSDLKNAKVDVVVRKTKNRNPSNPSLAALWNNERGIKNTQGLILVTPSQESLLRANDKVVVPLSQTMDTLKKVTNLTVNNQVNQLFDQSSTSNQNGVDNQKHIGDNTTSK